MTKPNIHIPEEAILSQKPLGGKIVGECNNITVKTLEFGQNG